MTKIPQITKEYRKRYSINFAPKRCFTPIEIETMKDFVNQKIIFGPYYGVPFRDLYAEYNKYANEVRAKKNLASQDLQKQKFWALLRIALIETGRDEEILTIHRKHNKRFMYSGLTLRIKESVV